MDVDRPLPHNLAVSVSHGPQKRIVKRYPYHDERGVLLFETVRFEPKSFAQRRPDGNGGHIWNLDGVRRVPYRLPQLLSSVGTVYVPEGEKDADRLTELGLTATCNPCGAGNWRDEFNQHFAGRDVVILPDNDGRGLVRVEDVAGNLFPLAKRVRIVWLSGLPPKGDVSDWLDAGHTIAELEEIAEQTPTYVPSEEVESTPTAEDGPERPAPLDPGPYRIEAGRICIEKDTQNGPIQKALCNFVAHVEEEVVSDDGAETTRAFILRGMLASGETLPPVRVPAAKFGGMSWVADQWGFGAIVNAGFSTRDQLREAIQRLSTDPRCRRVFTHTGWREIDGKWVYLTSNGAVGHDGFEVDLGTDLARYQLPLAPEGLKDAMRASLRLLGVAPLTVTVPLWGAMFRAPLASAFPLDMSLWLEGITGSLKSTLAAIFLSHYGAFGRTTLPGAWASTANQLERRAFMLKDLPFVIDDYAPSALDSRETETKASRLLRSQGNLSGRGRLRADLTERPAYPPRGLIVSTGEQHPPGQSLLARMLLLQLERDTVNLPALTEAQRTARVLPHAMAGYIQWLAPQMPKLPALLRETFEGARERATAAGEHLRVPEVLAHVWLGLVCGLSFAEELGACSFAEADAYRAQGWEALQGLGRAQGRMVEGERPSRRFLSVLLTLLGQHKALLLPKEDSGDALRGDAAFLGWFNEKFAYLMPEAAYRAVAQFCRESGEPFTTRQERLMRDLSKEGITECNQERHMLMARVGGRNRRTLCLRRREVEALLGEEMPCGVSNVSVVSGSGE